MTFNRRYFRIFLIFLILFGGFQIYEMLTIERSAISQSMLAGFVMLLVVIVGSAIWFLRNTKK